MNTARLFLWFCVFSAVSVQLVNTDEACFGITVFIGVSAALSTIMWNYNYGYRESCTSKWIVYKEKGERGRLSNV